MKKSQLKKIESEWELVRGNPDYISDYHLVRAAFKEDMLKAQSLEALCLEKWKLGGLPDPTLSLTDHRNKLGERKFKYWLRYFVSSLIF